MPTERQGYPPDLQPAPDGGRLGRGQRAFAQSHPCPSTGQANGSCRGYVRDHIVPPWPVAGRSEGRVARVDGFTSDACKPKLPDKKRVAHRMYLARRWMDLKETSNGCCIS